MYEHRLAAEGLTAGYDSRKVIQGIDVKIPENKISVIIGANACGKSTLLKSMARLIKPFEGKVVLDGKSITSIKPKKVARIMGLLPQIPVVPESITVADLVMRGRFPYQSFLGNQSEDDYRAVATALKNMGIDSIAQRNVNELSGGQRQRVWIAMALAQETDILLLDEPTTYLDVTHQIEILDLLTKLNKKRGTTIVMVLHDINLSCRYANHIIAIKDGRIVAEGRPKDIVTKDLIKDVFDLKSQIIEDPESGTPLMVPLWQH